MRGVLLPISTVMCVAGLLQPDAPTRPATPLDPIAAIVDAFASHAVVAMSDGRTHGDEQGHAFILTLIRDPRFATIVNDVVVECCNSLYQAVVDRFVAGDDVGRDALAPAWQNTTQVNANQRDCAFCERLFETVRVVNASRLPDRRLRVLLGDPPIDWDSVRTKVDHHKWLEMRDIFPADLIRHEVLEKKRRALVIYGGMHLQRKNLVANYESDGLAATLVSRLESVAGIEAFTIWGAADPGEASARRGVVAGAEPGNGTRHDPRRGRLHLVLHGRSAAGLDPRRQAGLLGTNSARAVAIAPDGGPGGRHSLLR